MFCSRRLFLYGSAAAAYAENWPQWRGVSANGISTEKNLPTEWSPTKNIAWKTPIAGRGRSQPVVWGDRIFLTTDIEGEKIKNAPPVHKINGEVFRHPDSVGADVRHQLALLCLDRRTGKILWQQNAYEGPAFDERHKAGSYAAPTPVTDGKAVYAYFGSEGFYAYNFAGKLLWKFDPGKIETLGMGPGTSPILDDGLLILQCDSSDKKSKILALRASNGEMVWKTDRDIDVTWSTPHIVRSKAGRKELITTANDVVVAYDPATGRELWRGKGVKGNAIPTPISGQGIVVVSAGYPDKLAYAFEAGANGKPLWEYTKGTAYVPSPLLYGDHVYLVTDAGLLTCLDARTGKVHYEGKRPPEAARYAGSPVAFDGKILLTSENGDTHVIQAGPEFAVLRTNSIGEPVLASLALAHGMVLIRGRDHLFAIGR